MNTQARTCLIFIILGSLWLSACRSADQKAPPGQAAFPPVPVQIAQATEELVPTDLKIVGTVEPYSSVEIKSQVAGQLMTVRFAEGANIQKGQLLFEIDPTPYQQSLGQAEADLAKTLAQLRQSEARLARDQAQLKNADAEVERYRSLVKEGLSPRMQEDQIRTAAEVAQQAVRADEAEIESFRAIGDSARSAVDRARLDLSYAQIRSPLSGRAGNLMLHAGNLVKANDSALVTINQVTPIFVTFGVPERYLGTISQRGTVRKLVVQASIDKGGEDIPSNEAGVDTESGTLAVVDNAVDPATGTIRLKAVFDNRDQRLLPGQFINVVLTLDRQMQVLIPAESVQAGQEGSFVYVAKADRTVEVRPVSPGQVVSGKVIIEKGIAAGETVVTDGQSRLFPGAPIQPPGN